MTFTTYLKLSQPQLACFYMILSFSLLDQGIKTLQYSSVLQHLLLYLVLHSIL